MQKTTNLDLNKPEGSDAVNIDDLNENADIIDEKFAGGSAGHKHTGAAGDGAPIPIDGIDASSKTTAGGNQANRLAVTGANGRVGDSERLAGLTLTQLDQRVDSTITGAHLLNKIKTVDGAGSGLDADLVRGGIALTRRLDGGVHRLPDGQDLNSITDTGFYDGSNLVNTPPQVSQVNPWWYIEVFKHSQTDYCMQRATTLNDNAGEISLFIRQMRHGTWSEWKEVGGGVKSVQRGLAQLTADRSNEETINVTISPVNLSKSFVNISQTGNLPAGVRVRLTSGTNLEIYLRSVAQLTGINYISWEVIEYD